LKKEKLMKSNSCCHQSQKNDILKKGFSKKMHEIVHKLMRGEAFNPVRI